MALGKFALAARIHNERHMRHFRRLPAKVAIQEQVLRRRGKPFLPANDMRDPHGAVVHHMGQMVGGHPVGLDQNLVVYVLGRKGNRSPDSVLERDAFAGLHLHPDHMLVSPVEAATNLCRGQRQRVGHLPARGRVVFGRRVLLCGEPLPHGFYFFGRIECVVRMPLVDQPLRVHGVEQQPFGLAIGLVAPAFPWSFVRLDAGPQKAGQDIFFGFRRKTRLIGILDAKHENALVLAREKVIEKRRSKSAQVQGSGGTGRKTNPDAGCMIVHHSRTSAQRAPRLFWNGKKEKTTGCEEEKAITPAQRL